MAAELMGGAVLSSVLNAVFDGLSSPEVVNWLRRKKLSQKLLGRLKTTLYAVQALLNDAENRPIKETVVKDWLDSLKDAVYVADDLLDEASTKAATQKEVGNFWSRYFNLQDRDIVNRIEDIIDTLESIVKQKDTLGLKEIPKENMSWRITTSLVERSDIYGRDGDKDAIIKLLLDDTTDDEISVIPIVGLGGIGKTTLAQLVYHEDKVKQNFNFQAWVFVSEEFDAIKVTRSMMEAITHGCCNTNDLNLLQHDLNEKLSRRKFLVVLDDVWNENYDDWNRLLKPFQHGVKGSKILVTTRSRKVANVVQTVLPHELSLLSHEDCWLLFAKHAFLSTKSIENPTLEKVGKEIVSKCNGLPLAAQTLGGLLRGNCDVRYWDLILKSEIWEFSEERSKIVPALRISYYYLPSCLKECFIYCSLYPKDYRFERDELILLWMAENFLQPMGKKTLEEVGYEYFDELVARSFLQPCRTSDCYFVMHDLLHDLAVFYAGEFYFRAKELGDATEIGMKTRHLSHNARGSYPISKLLLACDKVKHIRTFLEINLKPWVPFNMENSLCVLLSQFKHLRVLLFNSFTFDHDSLPDSIGELIHLRYLDLSNTRIVRLPESLSNLYNLQTLKLKDCCRLKMLPSGMQNLVNLRHLDVRGAFNLEEMPKGMSKLKHLQLLSYYIVGKHEENGIRELGDLAYLHGSLSITKLQNVINSGNALEARMVKKHINILLLSWSSNGNIVDSQSEKHILDKLQPHLDLKELIIWGYRGTIFPGWLGHSSYHTVTNLTLGGCRNCCMLPSFGKLPSLKHLSISYFDGLETIGAEFYKSDESCWETPFPSLDTLQFCGMSCWKVWRSFEFDAFPQLKELTIIDCPVLVGDLPNHLPALEKLSIRECKQLSCSLPIAPAILELSIYAVNEVRMQELPLSLCSLSIEGCQLVGYVFEAITHTQPTCLRSLTISNCSSAISFPERGLPPSLRRLYIRQCEKLVSCLTLMDLHSHHLTNLVICGACDSLRTFPMKEGCLPAYLASLYLSSFSSLETLDCKGLLHLISLQHLYIKNCPKLENIVGERLPASLIQLVISGSPFLVKRCEMKDPQIWPKISHICKIEVDGRWIF